MTIRHALSAEKLGVDCLSIDGYECAGHPGEDDIPGLVLLARAAQALSIPYIASGGMATARSLAAALSLGAQGANMGTRFMCTVESPIHENIKREIVNAKETDTVLMLRPFRNTARIFKNKVAQEVVKIQEEKSKAGNLQFQDVQSLVSGAKGRTVYTTGDSDAGVWSAGMTIGLIKDVPTCKEFIDKLEKETEEIIGGLGKLVVTSAKL